MSANPSGLLLSAEPAQLAIVPRPGLGPLFAHQPVAPGVQIKLPDPRAQKQAEERFAVIEPLRDYAACASLYAALRLRDGRACNSLQRMIQYQAETHNRPLRTVERWLNRYRAGGFPALADSLRADKGQSRWFNAHRDAAVLAAYLYLVEKMSVSYVAEQIEFEAEALGLDAARLPSHETVRVFLAQSISPAMKTLAREGQRQYRERMAPFLSRAYVDVFANQIWVGDHAIHDVEVSNDLFDEVPYGTPGRLRISAFIDYRSRKAWATWCWEGSSRSISATLLRAMLDAGPPEGIYVDNGKDFRKVAKGATPASKVLDDAKAPARWWEREYQGIEKTGFLSRMGISVTHCIPRHPQSKHVERFFRTMHIHFDACHSTYTSGSPFTRPESTELAMMRHRRLLKAGRVAESSHPLASRFVLGCLKWLDIYNATPQEGEGMEGRSPNEIFASDPNPNQKPMPEPAALALLLCEYERRRVRECAVTLGRRRYTPRATDRLAWAALHESNEREILIAFDPCAPEHAAALDLDGRFIAWLEAEQLVRFAPADPQVQARIAESMSIRRGLEKATRATLTAIAGAARAKGAQSAEEALYARLQLPAAVGEVVTQRRPRLQLSIAQIPMTPAQVARTLLEEE